MLIRFIMSFLAALALNIRFDIPEDMNRLASQSKMLNIFYNFQGSLTGTMAAATTVFVMLCIIEVYLYKKKTHRRPLSGILCFIIAIVWAMGESFYRVNSLALLHAGAGQMMKTCVYILGITWFLSEMATLLDCFLQSGWDWLPKKKLFLSNAYHKHPFRVSVLALFICWLPNLVLSYPATMCIDVWNQMLQSFGYQRFTTHHPPAHTVLAGAFERMGLLVGSANLGLFLYILFQTILFAIILGYMFYTMYKLTAPTWLKVFAFVTAIASPYYTQYIGMIVKDTIYSYFMLLFMIELVYILLLKTDYWKSKGHIVLLAISMIGSILFRNNGKYVIYPMILFILGTVFLQGRLKSKLADKSEDKSTDKSEDKSTDKPEDKSTNKSEDKSTDNPEDKSTNRLDHKSESRAKQKYTKILLTAVIVCVISVAISSGTQTFLTKHYNIEPGGIQEALSLPFQQTARYVKEHGDEVTAKEKEAIKGVLAYNKLAKYYNPKISDPVKATYKKKATTQDLEAYIKVWVQQGLKHPMTYIEATMNQNYYLVYPLVENNTVYDTTAPDKVSAKKLAEKLGVHEIPAIQKLDRWRTGFNKVFFTLPIFGLLASMAFFNLILIYLCYDAIRKKISQMILLLMPLLLSDAVIVLAPVIKGHPRYAFPIIYAMPIVFCAYLFFVRKKQDVRNK